MVGVGSRFRVKVGLRAGVKFGDLSCRVCLYVSEKFKCICFLCVHVHVFV